MRRASHRERIPASLGCVKKHPCPEKISMFSELHGKCKHICREMSPGKQPSQAGSTFL